MLLENIYKNWWGQQSAKEASNQQKLYTILFIYNTVDVNKIATAFFAKPPP